MELYYINNKNEKLNLSEYPYGLKDVSEIRDFDWNYKNTGERITSFSKGISSFSLSINVLPDSSKEFRSAINTLHEIMEYDVINNVRGRLYFEGQYIICNVVTSQKKDWDKGIDFSIVQLNIVTDTPYWLSERLYCYLPEVESNGENISYPRGYQRGYHSKLAVDKVVNDSYLDTDFEMTIFGKCIEPLVNIGGQTYKVEAMVEDGEYIVINTLTRKIYLVKRDGSIVNHFMYRYPRLNFFRKIPPGNVQLTWSGDFGVNIKLLYRRSEPKWI